MIQVNSSPAGTQTSGLKCSDNPAGGKAHGRSGLAHGVKASPLRIESFAFAALDTDHRKAKPGSRVATLAVVAHSAIVPWCGGWSDENDREKRQRQTACGPGLMETSTHLRWEQTCEGSNPMSAAGAKQINRRRPGRIARSEGFVLTAKALPSQESSAAERRVMRHLGAWRKTGGGPRACSA